MAKVDHPARLGTVARTLRRSQGLTLDVIAQRSGLSKGFLSHLESGSANPTLGSLVSVADALGADLAELFRDGPIRRVAAPGQRTADGAADDAAAAAHFVRPPTVRPEDESRTYRLTPAANQLFEVLLSDGGPDGSLIEAHEGWEFVHVVSGRAQLDIASQPEILEEGDSISYDSRQPHAVRAVAERTRLLIVICPPLAS